ncbi:MAG: hypothetical protein AB9844_06675 [Clostridiaceae bacterium]
MAKCDYEFKKKIVNAYMNGEGGKQFLANKDQRLTQHTFCI